MSRRSLFAGVLSAAVASLIFISLVTGLVTVNAWRRYGAWGFSIAHGCTGIGYIHQSPQAAQDTGWFTNPCE